MKSINFNSRITKEIKANNEEMANIEEGVTKALLEKYKPKILYKIENFSEEKVQRRLA